MDNVSTPWIGRWRLWPQFALRGTGFPAQGVLRLAPEGLAEAAAKFASGADLTGAQWDAFAGKYAAAALSVSLELQQIAALPAFRAAVAWQNRTVLTSGIAPFLRWVPELGKRPSMARQREELVAHYWQRFCVKNDTIGFFGPVGWGTWDLSTPGVGVEAGTGLTAGSQVYFSSWAIDALARSVSEDPAVREWLAPRRLPFVRLAGSEVMLPGLPPVPVSPAQMQVLQRCDGTRQAREIERELGAGVPDVLASLVKRHWVVWRLDVPADVRPESRLREILDRIGDEAIRKGALAKLDALERGRDQVHAAGRDPDALVTAIDALEAEFTELTAAAAQRQKGQAKAPCRALVYSDSTRSARATAGTDLLDALAPLNLLLAAASWLTSSLAERVMARARQVYAEHASRAGASSLDLATCWFACMNILVEDAELDARSLQRQFWDKWHAILNPAPGARRLRLTGEQIADRVHAAFGEPEGGWARRWGTGRYACPDMLVVADDAQALNSGDFEIVLGEMHLAINTLSSSLFVHQHPRRAELLDLTSRDHPRPRLMPLQPKEHRARLSARTRYSLVRPEDYCVALVDPSADPYRERTVMSGECTVRDRDGRLVVTVPDGAEFDLVDVFSQALTMLVQDMFRIVPSDAGHFPRVTIDRMIIARETWRFDPGTLEFAEEKDEAKRYVRAGQWRAAQGLPRFAFVVSPTEPRPFYVDFDSPVYSNIFTKAIRRLRRNEGQSQGQLTISEMVPTPEQTWLTDDQGSSYTSELRFVAVDDGRG